MISTIARSPASVWALRSANVMAQNRRCFSSAKTALEAQTEEQLLKSVSSKSKEIQQKLHELQTKSEAIRTKQAQDYEQFLLEESKPKIGDFKVPLAGTFVLASAVYLSLQWLYTTLEKEEALATYQGQVKSLEDEIQVLLESKAEHQQRGWFNWLWKRS